MDQDSGPEVELTRPRRAVMPSLRRARLLRSVRHLGLELVVVALGVLLALAAQQWAEDQAWRKKARETTASLRSEIASQYTTAVEWRAVEPCVLAQIDVLQQRLLASGDRLDPAPTYSEPGFAFYVIRLPNRTYEEGVWQTSIGDGVNSHLEPLVRQHLDAAYTANRVLANLNTQNNAAYQRLLSLTRPLPLDPGVRFALLQDLDELRGRVELMSLLSGQSLDNWDKAGMLPASDVGRAALTSSGTRRFCDARGLPMRSADEAERPVPY
jgi:hypothetical protein